MTDAVHAWLVARHPLGWWTKQQITAGVSRHPKAVDWSLLFLRATGRIEITEDPRCTRYLRYRVVRSTLTGKEGHGR